MAFHKMASGHFAYVINESGNRQLVTQEQFEDCCCPAPLTCPCEGAWPPATWPCGGLLETYSAESVVWYEPSTGRMARPLSGSVILNPGSLSCSWISDFVACELFISGSGWGSTTTLMSIGAKLEPPYWEMRVVFGVLPGYGRKDTGLSLAGTFERDTPYFREADGVIS
jgi:hypothetical protein